jgi:glycosyltransferase involved in cell wall biosynthesis
MFQDTPQLRETETVARAQSFRSVLHLGKFYPPHVGGIESHLQTLCTELSKSMSVRVLVANDARRMRESLIDGVVIARHGSWVKLAGAPICPSMVTALRRTQADLVHVHLPNPGAVLAVLASGYKGSLIATWHSDVVRQRRLAKLFGPVQQHFLRRCDAIITTSRRYAESSRELAPFRAKCRVVPYGLQPGRYRSVRSAEVKAIREKYGAPIVLAVGRLVYYKGFEHLIRAMKQISARLLIVGDGPLRGSLQQLASALGIANKVVFLGEMQAEEITPYYHSCELFVLPSIARSEAFGIVQLEAMACGKPVINTDIDSGTPFVSIDGVTGLTVQPNNSDVLAKAIDALLHNEELRNKYGQAARHRVQTEFHLSKMVARTLDIYAQVANATGTTKRNISQRVSGEQLSA